VGINVELTLLGHNLLFSILFVGDTIDCPPSIQLMEAEAALYWRTVCKHLQSEAHVSKILFSYLFISLNATPEKECILFFLILLTME